MKKISYKKPVRSISLMLSFILIFSGSVLAFSGCGAKDASEGALPLKPEAKDEAPAEEEQAEKAFDPSSVETVKAGAREEIITVKADPSGTPEKITVSSTLSEIKDAEGKYIADPAPLTDIKNTRGEENFYTVDGTTYWEYLGQDINYEGKIEKEIPVDVKVTYFLDGEEIEPERLKGKSGHVEIRFDYNNKIESTVNENDKTYNMRTPFLIVSMIPLDEDVFTNVGISKGKIMSLSGERIAAGFTITGLNDDLRLSDHEGLDDIDLPDSITVSADVTDFTLPFTETIVTSSLFSEDEEDEKSGEEPEEDADTGSEDDQADDAEDTNDDQADDEEDADGSEEDDADDPENDSEDDINFSGNFDEVIDSMDKLGDASKEIADASDELYDGASSFRDGLSAYVDGAYTLSNGITQLNNSLSGIDLSSLSGGGSENSENDPAAGLTETMSSVKESMTALYTDVAALAQGIAALSEEDPRAAELNGTVSDMQKQLDALQNTLNTLSSATSGSSDIQSSLSQIQTSFSELQKGVKELDNGGRALAESGNGLLGGYDTLLNGVSEFRDGVKEFDSDGIQKLVEFAKNDLGEIIDRFRAVKKAGSSYGAFTVTEENQEGSAVFMIETGEIE